MSNDPLADYHAAENWVEYKDAYKRMMDAGYPDSYAAGQCVREHRNAALEESAKACEALQTGGRGDTYYDDCAAAIRGLKTR
jgi:hypothetical protein